NGKTTIYTYTKGFADDRLNHNLLAVIDAKGQTYLRNEYSATTNPSDRQFDRIVKQTWGNTGEAIKFTYLPMPPTVANGQAVLGTIVNDGVGNVTKYDFDARNRLLRQREFTGRADPGQPTTPGSNRPTGKLRAGDPDCFETTWGYN